MGRKKRETIIRKLTSRKLWLSVAGFVSGIVIICGGSKETGEQVSGAVMSGAAIIAYCVGEGLADGDNKNK